MKQKLYLLIALLVNCFFVNSQTYDHVYSSTVGVFQDPSWVAGQEYEIENFPNFSKCHTNITIDYSYDLESDLNGVVNMYAVNTLGENLVGTATITDGNPVNGSLTIDSDLYPIDNFIIKWEIGNTDSSNFIFKSFTFTATSPLASMPNTPVISDITYAIGQTASPLTADGTNLKWYASNSGGMPNFTAPTPSTASIGSTSYWVSSSDAEGCESQRVEVIVNVIASTPATYLNFDGVDDRVELKNESNFDFTSTFSLEAWIRVSSFTQEWQTVITKGAEGPRIHRYGGSNFIAFGTGPANDLASTVSVNDGNWHHIAATCNNGLKTLYVDGALQGTQTVSTPLVTNNDNVRIGSQIDSYSPIRAFHGDIDEVRIWSVAKTAEEINASINCELAGNETGLVAYYKFNQGNNASDNSAITSLTDATDNGNDGTLTNFELTADTSNFSSGSPIVTGTTCTTLNTSNFDITENIRLYPNPTNNFVSVEVNNLTNVSVTVFDLNGRQILNKEVSNNANTIDISNLETGMYLFKIKSLTGEAVKKVIKN